MLPFGACGFLAFGLNLHGRSLRCFVKQSVTTRRIASIPHHCSTSTLSAAAMLKHPVDALPVARLWSCVSTKRASFPNRSAQSAAPKRADKACFALSNVKPAFPRQHLTALALPIPAIAAITLDRRCASSPVALTLLHAGPPSAIEELNDVGFVIKNSTGQKLAYVYYEDELPNLLSKDEARRIAANIAKLPELALI
jgi:hypothetical protein